MRRCTSASVIGRTLPCRRRRTIPTSRSRVAAGNAASAIKRAISETPSLPHSLYDQAMALEKRNNDIIRALSGDAEARRRNMITRPSINDRVGYVVGAQRMSTSRPTQTQQNQYGAAAQDFEAVLTQLRQLIEVDVSRLEKQLEAAGAPWTPGRIPEWRDQ